MSDAVAEYARQLDAPESWMLGRLVVPVARLAELSAESARYTGARREPWRVSALCGEMVEHDVDVVRTFNRDHLGRLVVDTMECRTGDVAAIAQATRAAAGDLAVFCELPIERDPTPLLAELRDRGARAKVRTGGTSPDAFPSTAKLARFIARCAQLEVPFKATAGLHHPLRGEQRLTYESNAPSATMFGFLNVFVAAALARTGLDELGIARVLEERELSSFELGATSLRWHDQVVPLDQLTAARRSFALSFGSCSFSEPVDDLRQLALL
jgi:hypothetical protein